MRVYEPTVPEGFEWVLPADDDVSEVFARFDGTPRRQDWVPVRVERLTEDGGERFTESDFPWLGSDALVLRRRAVDVLEPALAGYGELPLACDDAELWVLNVTRVIDALDEQRSKLTHYSDGGIMRVEQHQFHPERIEGVLLFKIPQFPRAGSIYVSDDFVRLVESSGLRGLGFDLLWEGGRDRDPA